MKLRIRVCDVVSLALMESLIMVVHSIVTVQIAYISASTVMIRVALIVQRM